MKRVGLSRFRPLEVSRTVQHCLRLEGVNNANGGHSDSEEGDSSSKETEDGVVLCDGSKAATVAAPQAGDWSLRSSNLLTTLRKKLRKPRRNKRSEGFRCENCELIGGCPRHLKTRRQKCDKNVWPVPASVLRCQNHQNSRSEDVAELISSLADDSSEDCSCFVPPLDGADCCKSSTDLIPRASSSLSDLAHSSGTEENDLAPKVEPESDVRDAVGSAELESTCSLCPAHSSNSNDNNNDVACCVKETVAPEARRVGNLTSELQKLSKYGWYWGPITRSEAESKLVDQPDGAFLVRDSSDDRYILSLSFRSYHKTFHTRIEHSNGLFSFYSQPEPGGHASIVELIKMSMCLSQSGVFCYSRSRSPGAPSIPVRLTKPVSRFTQVRSLQYLCRFVIRQNTRYDHIQKLPLPPRIKGYLEEGHY